MILPLLLTIQVSTPSPSEDAIRNLEQILARPAFARFSAEYERVRSKGLVFSIDSIVGWRMRTTYPGVALLRPSGAPRYMQAWEGDLPPSSEAPPLSEERLLALAEGVREQATPGEVWPHVRVVSSPVGARFFTACFRRDLGGYPLGYELSVELHRWTGEVKSVHWPRPVDATGVDPRRFLSVEVLRGRTYAAVAAKNVLGQFEAVTDEIAIGGFDDPARPKEDEYGRLSYPLKPDPQFDLVLIDAEDGGMIRAGAVATTGLAWSGTKVSPLGPSSLKLAPLPEEAQAGATRGRLARLSKTSADPVGELAFVQKGKRFFAGRYDAKSGTLWLRRTGQEAYHALRPDSKLREALAVQLRRDPKPNLQR